MSANDDPAAMIRYALHLVIDPELGENVVELGLIYAIDVSQDGLATIVMTTTTKGCPAAAYLKEAVHAAASAAPGIHAVDLRMTWEPPWSPERIGNEARQRLGFREASGPA